MSKDKPNDPSTSRRHFSFEDKIKILRLHLLEKVPVSEVCEKHQMIPMQFYQWQKTFFEIGTAAFSKGPNPRAGSKAEQRVAAVNQHLCGFRSPFP